MTIRERRDDRDGGEAFLPDPRKTRITAARDTLAEMVGEGFVSSATTGGESGFEERRDAVTEEELGGPFLEVDAEEELAEEVDALEPRGGSALPRPANARAPKS